MPYKISGTKSETARVIVLKESDWSIESNTVVSGSGAYDVEELEAGNKLVVARTNDGEMLGYGAVASLYYAPAVGDRGIFGGGQSVAGRTNVIEYITISTAADASDFGDLLNIWRYTGATSNGVTGRGLFVGGGDNAGPTNVIQYVTITSTGNATNFGDLTVGRYSLGSTSNA